MYDELLKYKSTGVIEIVEDAFKINEEDNSLTDTGYVKAIFVDPVTEARKIVEYAPQMGLSTPYLTTKSGTWFIYKKDGTIIPKENDLQRENLDDEIRVFRVSHFAFSAQPNNVTGVSLYSPTGIYGNYDLVYTVLGQTLAWHLGTPIAVGDGGAFTLADGAGNSVRADVRVNDLPGSNQIDLAIATSDVGIITAVFVLPIFANQDLDSISKAMLLGTTKISGLELDSGGNDLSLKRSAGKAQRPGAGESRKTINFANMDEVVGYSFIPAWSASAGVAVLGPLSTQIKTDKFSSSDGVLKTVQTGFYSIIYELSLPSYNYETSTKRVTTFLIYGYREYKSLQAAIDGVGGSDIVVPFSLEGGMLTGAIIVRNGETNLTIAETNGNAYFMSADQSGKFPEQIKNRLTNEIKVNSLKDIPYDGITELAPFTQYVLNEDIQLPDDMYIIASSSGSCGITSVAGKTLKAKMTSPGALIRGNIPANESFGFFGNMSVECDVEHTDLFNLSGDGTASFSEFVVKSCKSLGTISTSRFIQRSGFDVNFWGNGLTLNNVSMIKITSGTIANGLNSVGAKALIITGTVSKLKIVNFDGLLNPNESLIYVDPSTADNLQGIGIIHACQSTGGSFWAPGSADGTHPRVKANANDPISDSVSNAYISALDQEALSTNLTVNIWKRLEAAYTEINSEGYVTYPNGNVKYAKIQDVYAAIFMTVTGVSSGTTAMFEFAVAKGSENVKIISFADAGGGKVTVTTDNPHEYSDGDIAIIEDTTNYNGGYSISNVAGTTYQITAPYIATEAGNTYKVLLYSKISNQLKNEAGNTVLITQIPLKTSDIGFICVRDITSNDDYNLTDIHVSWR